MKLLVAPLGQVAYREALLMQEQLLGLRQQDLIPDTLLLLEHPPTLTFGKRVNWDNIIFPKEKLEALGVDICKTNRGGDVTYHGPGQIVGYPIIDLSNHGKSIKGYIHKLEQIFIDLLAEEYSVKAGRDDKHPGVWISDEKITAIGCAVKHSVTIHGFAFNVNTNLNHYQWINPCGITDKGVTSLQEKTGQQHSISQVTEMVLTYFCKIFKTEAEIITRQELNKLIGR